MPSMSYIEQAKAHRRRMYQKNKRKKEAREQTALNKSVKTPRIVTPEKATTTTHQSEPSNTDEVEINPEFEKEWNRRLKTRKHKRLSRERAASQRSAVIRKRNRKKQKQIDRRKKRAVTRLFERKCRDLKHSHCVGCRSISINLQVNTKGYCSQCNRRYNKDYLLTEKLLPIWYLEGIPQYHLPECLTVLTHAEKMLIQRVSPFVPLHHIKSGIFGLSGHVCAFEQKITEMARVLPRHGRDTTVLRVLQEVKSEIGGDSTMTRAFRVRKRQVMDALIWLRQYNKEYADIVIDESRLAWLDGDEADLDAYVVHVEDLHTSQDDNKTNADMGPSKEQCLDPQKENGDDVHAYGYIADDGPAELSPEDGIINTELQHAIDQAPNKHTVEMEWPEISDMPVSEYDDTRVFARAFPWLFPGGFGDIKDYDNIDKNMSEWGKRLLYYEDGRFAKDKLFCFFAMNYIIRHRNSSSGKFFIDNFQKNVPETLDELKETIKKGDMRFVNHLTYWNKRIKGSNPYWFQKRAEVYAWINEHIQLGHGAPSYFITLSCAEHYWPDVIELLKERLEMAGLDSSDCYIGSSKLSQYVNDYTLVIQEYFQRRVELWLESVGKSVFGIKHYWVRYEFAPGRGQIHAHLLAIPENHDVFEDCYQLLQEHDGANKRAHHLSQWAEEQFGLTASINSNFEERNTEESKKALTVRFTDVTNDDDDAPIEEDCESLMHAVQMHDCSDFCMRKGHDEQKRRICKVGCGTEATLGKADTPGFDIHATPKIKTDHRRAQKLCMPRNNPRLNQTSTDLLQSWRGNCDVQVLICDCDPKHPNLAEIAKVTDYVVSYACKGNTNVKEEREQNRNLILHSEDRTGDQTDIKRVCKQVMNKAVTKRIISKQEATVLLADLDLFACTETIESVSISNGKRISISDEDRASRPPKTFVNLYANRPNECEHMTLHDYFHHYKNNDPDKPLIIPNFVGLSGTPCYPVSTEYARHTLIVHRPWRKYPNSDDWIGEFNQFINSPQVPTSAKLTYERVMQRHIDKMTHYEAKAATVDHSGNPISEEDLDLMHLVGLKDCDEFDAEDAMFKNLDKGLDFAWDKTPTTRNLADPETKPECWLKTKIEQQEKSTDVILEVPLKDDGTEYSVDDLFKDQKEVVTVIINTLHDFMTMDDLSQFKPLRIVVNGQGGSGKSVVINTIVTIIRKMFGFNDVVRVIAPTGVAAYNVNGETFHHFFHMGVSGKEYNSNNMAKATRKKLIQKFRTLLALVIDERSLVPSKLLGTAEAMASETMHGGCYHQQDSWGGLPIVVLVGDDYQLPGIGEGAFTALLNRYGSKMTYNGRKALMECAEMVMELGKSKRVNGPQNETRALLDRLRVGEPSDADVDKLMSLHLDNVSHRHGSETTKDIEDKAMFLFFKNKKRIAHNTRRLLHQASKENPVAVIKSRTHGRTMAKGIRSHFDSELPTASVFCEGSKVAINSRNFMPAWGLHNGACGTAIEIVFAPGHNPNNGDMPLYTVVDFPLYCGPPWDKDNPTFVPIPCETFICQRKCCERVFCPLTVAYARTIHKFQGLTVGPVPEGTPPNLYETIVCDPDEKAWEGSALGLLYTAVSRGTTLGDDDGLNSAVYFKGPSMKPERVRNLRFKAGQNKEFELAKKRRFWVNYLHGRTRATKETIQPIIENQDNLVHWGKTTTYSYDDLHFRIQQYKRRTSPN